MYVLIDYNLSFIIKQRYQSIQLIQHNNKIDYRCWQSIINQIFSWETRLSLNTNRKRSILSIFCNSISLETHPRKRVLECPTELATSDYPKERMIFNLRVVYLKVIYLLISVNRFLHYVWSVFWILKGGIYTIVVLSSVLWPGTRSPATAWWRQQS